MYPFLPVRANVGAFVKEAEKHDERWSEVELLLIVGATENREMYVYKSVAESRVTNAALRAISLATQSRTVVEGENAPVSPCGPLCAIFLRKPSVYPLLSAKANVGHL